MSAGIVCIANPTSGGGHGGKMVALLREVFHKRGVEVTVCLTQTVGDGRGLAADVVRSGNARVVVVIGGDGTLSEVVDGMLSAVLKVRRGGSSTTAPEIDYVDGPVPALPAVAYLPAGTGADFARLGYCLANSAKSGAVMDHTFDVIADGGSDASRTATLDVGYVWSQSTNRVRYFINVASVGLSSAVVKRAERLKKTWIAALGGALVFMVAAAIELLLMRPFTVKLHPFTAAPTSQLPANAPILSLPPTDESNGVYSTSCTTLAFCNGGFFGGGMAIAPLATPTDRTLDVSVWREALLGFALGLRSVYNGRALSWKSTSRFTLRHTWVDGAADITFEIDGESGPTLPCAVGIAPLRLRFLVDQPCHSVQVDP